MFCTSPTLAGGLSWDAVLQDHVAQTVQQLACFLWVLVACAQDILVLLSEGSWIGLHIYIYVFFGIV